MAADKAIMPNNEFFDDPEEGSGLGGTTLRSGKSASRDVQNHRDQPKRARTDEDASSSTTKSNSKEGSGSKRSDSTSDKVTVYPFPLLTKYLQHYPTELLNNSL
ncbi:unnamed protein product [Schistosoma mattheei]|uniref:Uncharacterized protein n=1 Tax=Schistosoma mattheei TaxID=31246 RepID=A0A183NLF4_9TREM|nr:unnamed protein product [Schistosoma mattheei]